MSGFGVRKLITKSVIDYGSCLTESNLEQTDVQDNDDGKQKDVCLQYDGIPPANVSQTPWVCCNKKCPRCGGDGCSNQMDASGNKLEAIECCIWENLSKGKTCGSDGTNAPCKIPSNLPPYELFRR